MQIRVCMQWVLCWPRPHTLLPTSCLCSHTIGNLRLSVPQSGKSVCKRARLDSRTVALQMRLQTLLRVLAAQRTTVGSDQSVQR
jgi:hypothetical protein